MTIWAFATTKNCAAHAHGRQVVAFLRQHPCRVLRRMLATTALGGQRVGIAGEAVVLPGGSTGRPYGDSADFQSLISDPNAGGLDDLFRDGVTLPAGPRTVPSSAEYTYGGDRYTVYTLHGWLIGSNNPSVRSGLGQLLSDVSVLLGHSGF